MTCDLSIVNNNGQAKYYCQNCKQEDILMTLIEGADDIFPKPSSPLSMTWVPDMSCISVVCQLPQVSKHRWAGIHAAAGQLWLIGGWQQAFPVPCMDNGRYVAVSSWPVASGQRPGHTQTYTCCSLAWGTSQLRASSYRRCLIALYHLGSIPSKKSLIPNP